MGRADSRLRERVIFVVGARRSGTNWLERILRARGDVVAMPSETYLFDKGIKPLAERFQHLNPGSSLVGSTFIQREGFLDAVRDLVDRAFLDTLSRLAPDATYVLERTPWHAFVLDLIADVYPDARVVHIVRDGRAVARSLVAKDWGPSTIEEAAEEWRSSVEAGRRGADLFGERYAEVRYEELVADPPEQIPRLFERLGLAPAPASLDRVLLEAASEFNVDPGAPGISSDKWRGDLSASDLRRFDRVAGRLLEQLGYERAAPVAGRAGLLDASRRAVHAARKRVRRPRELREAFAGRHDRAIARRSLALLEGNFYVSERFLRALASGDTGAAAELLDARVRVRIVDEEARSEGRGIQAAERLFSAVREHEARHPRVLFGHTDSSAQAFTHVSTYLLDDGGRWTRTLVLKLSYPRITEIALYRFRLAAEVSAASAALVGEHA